MTPDPTPRPDWYDDPSGAYGMRYHDGQRWTDQVWSGGEVQHHVMSTSAPPPAGPAAGTAPGPTPGTLTRVQRMGYVALGCAALMVLGSLMPWASSRAGTISGIDARLGVVTALCGIGLIAWASQALRHGVARFQPGALTAVIIGLLVSSLASTLVGDLNTGTLGADVSVGIGLNLTLLGNLVIIWPLSSLWADARRRRQVPRQGVTVPTP